MWHIGQEIVALKTCNLKLIIKGQFYIIKGLRGSQCKCNDTEIDIGLNTGPGQQMCSSCKIIWNNNTGSIWISDRLFAPLSEISEVMEALKEEPFKII